MYFFDRKTMYFVWYREDGQARSVGSTQLTVVENVCRIEVSVTNCGRVDGEFPCYMLSGPVESLLGMLRLSRGKGALSLRCEADKVGHAQVPYGKLTGIHIDLREYGYLEQKWLPLQPNRSKAGPTEEFPGHMISDIMPYRRRENDTEKNIEQLKAEAETVREKKWETGPVEEKVAATESVGKTVPEAESDPERALDTEKDPEKSAEMISDRDKEAGTRTFGEEELDRGGKRRENRDIRKGAQAAVREPHEEKQPVHLYADKWQQLCAIYPIVHPFGDARGYLSIEPRDFVILQERYQVMVQNSFLLHGFYNYRHLLLGRQRGEREMNYYLGVPGVLYEKERAAALFYGFEGFESAKIPAEEGSFGYYMKNVQI
ncbi:MAG: hypothetical protein LUC90_04940 [Lachnospiraceae bacterium]|nr:hypothetical protein [Lachnospiraceae bacterium]